MECLGLGFFAVTILGPAIAAACVGLRSVTASATAGAAGPGFVFFAVTIRIGIAGDCLRLRARFGR
jgi:hypothetical protein